MEYEKITKLLGSTSDKVPRFITKRERSLRSIWRSIQYLQTNNI